MGNSIYNACDNCDCKLDCFEYEIEIRDEDQNKGVIKPSLSIHPLPPESSPEITPRNETLAYGVTHNF